MFLQGCNKENDKSFSWGTFLRSSFLLGGWEFHSRTPNSLSKNGNWRGPHESREILVKVSIEVTFTSSFSIYQVMYRAAYQTVEYYPDNSDDVSSWGIDIVCAGWFEADQDQAINTSSGSASLGIPSYRHISHLSWWFLCISYRLGFPLVDEDISVGYKICTTMSGSRLNLADWYSAFMAHFTANLPHVSDQTARKSRRHWKSDQTGLHGNTSPESNPANCPTVLARFEMVLLQLQHLGIIKKSGEHAKCLMFNK